MTISTGYTSKITGRTNSAALAALSNADSPYEAAVACEGLTSDGHSDWYLPAKNELSIIYSNKDAIGNFSVANYYWSSTEVNISSAYYQNFSNGSQYSGLKRGTYLARCARR